MTLQSLRFCSSCHPSMISDRAPARTTTPSNHSQADIQDLYTGFPSPQTPRPPCAHPPPPPDPLRLSARKGRDISLFLDVLPLSTISKRAMVGVDKARSHAATPSSLLMHGIFCRPSDPFTRRAYPFRILCMVSYPGIVRRAVWNPRKPCFAFTRRWIARWSCSRMLFRYGCVATLADGSNSRANSKGLTRVPLQFELDQPFVFLQCGLCTRDTVKCGIHFIRPAIHVIW